MDTFTQKSATLHRWQCGASTFIARPELGARLMSWKLQGAGDRTRSIIHWPENADFDRFPKVRGGNPILFPFSARSFHQGKENCWADARGVVRPMPRHGFSRTGKFLVTDLSADGFTAELQPTKDDRAAYPFAYAFRVRYVFEESALRVFMTLENLDKQPILWSAGHHFYFTLPWQENTSRADYHFKIPAKLCYTQSPDGSLNPITPVQSEDTFGAPGISDRIFTQLSSGCAQFGKIDGSENVRVRILQDTDTASSWNAFVIWSESDKSPFYCVEPWMGPPNSVEHGKGLQTVQPGERSCFAVEVSV